jgi:hypothetical protein
VLTVVAPVVLPDAPPTVVPPPAVVEDELPPPQETAKTLRATISTRENRSSRRIVDLLVFECSPCRAVLCTWRFVVYYPRRRSGNLTT